MLRTVIIDDEELIRRGLEVTIPWEELGFEIVGFASDGEQAIEVLKDTMPDVIITDIRMPFMTGLELIEFIKPLLPNAYIVIISGHDEFHYAQKALQFGVYDFILKPFDLDHLVKTLKKIKYDFTLNKNPQPKSILEEDLLHLQTNLFEKIIYNKLPIDLVTAKLETYQLKGFEHNFYTILLCQIDNFQLVIADKTFDEINSLHLNYYSLIKTISPPSPKQLLLETNNGDALIILSAPTIGELDMRKHKVINQLRNKFNNELIQSITIASSQNIQDIIYLKELYTQARQSVNQKYIIGYNHDISYSDIKSTIIAKNTSTEFSFSHIGYDREVLNKYLTSVSTESMTNYFQQITQSIINEGYNMSIYVIMFVTTIYTEIINTLSKHGLSIGDIYDDPHKIYKSLHRSQNIYDTKDILIDLALTTSDYLNSHKVNNYDPRIKEAKHFIEENYNSYDITLQNVAEEVNMGVCYFSSMFKKETGESFINYLTNIRINKAKELFLTTDLKAYEISYKVGYNTPTYFSTLFKKNTGYSPSTFRSKES